MRTSRILFLLSILLSLAFVSPGWGQDAPLAEEPLSEGEGKLEGDRKIYVPFKDLKDVFEKEGQGVFVPIEEFMRLWNANLDRRQVPAEPPVPYLVTRATYEGEVEGDLAVIRARVEFETFTPGWSAVPLRFAGIALGEAKLDGEPATLDTVKGAYRVHVPEKGSYTLTVSFVTAIGKKEDLRTVSFRVPATPVSRLVFDVPEERAKVTVKPNLATTRTEAGSGVTRVMAYVGAADSIQLSWKPKPVEEEKGPALIFADSVVTAVVEEAALRIKADLAYTIHRAPVDRFEVTIPGDARVLFVEGPELRTWDMADGKLTVTLHKPAEKGYRLSVTLEAELPESGAVAVPEVAAVGVAREQGFVLVRAPATMKVLPTATGLYRTDFAAVPKSHRAKDLVVAWRYPAHPWTLSLDVTRIRPVVEVDGRAHVKLGERAVTMHDWLNYKVTRAPIFQARVALPEGLTITDVARDVVEDFRVVEEEGRRILVLDLKGSRIGAFSVQVTGRRDLELDEEEATDVPLPLLTALDVRRLSGLVGVARDASLKLETKDVTGLVPVAAATFGGGVALAYRYAEADRGATVVVTRRDPEITARVATTLKAEQNRVAVRSRITFTVRYAGVDRFGFRMPAALKDEAHVTGNNIREKPIEEIDGEPEWVLQRVELQGKVQGDYALDVVYDIPYGDVEKGETVPVPVLVVEDVKREEGVYAVYREPVLEVTADTTGLELIDPRELPPGVDRTDVFLAYKYLAHPHELSLSVTKHEYLPVVQAVVHHMHLVTVLNEEGISLTRAEFVMTNNGLQFLKIALQGGKVPDSLRVQSRQGGWKSETPQAGPGGSILVRMPSWAGPDDRFRVELIYSIRDGLPGVTFHDFDFEAPVIQDGDVAPQGTTWRLYPPSDVKLTQVGGALPLLDRGDSWWSAVVNHLPRLFRPEAEKRQAAPGGTVFPSIKDTRFAPAGQQPLLFGGRSREPGVEITFADPGVFAFLKVLVLLGVLAGGVIGLRRSTRAVRGWYTLSCVALPLLLIPVSAVGLAEVLTALLLGGLIAGIYWCAKALLVRFGRNGPPPEFTPAPPVPAPAPPAPAPPAVPEAPKKKATTKKTAAKKKPATKKEEE